MRALSWQTWAIIGVTVLAIFAWSLVIRLSLELKRLHSAEAKLQERSKANHKYLEEQIRRLNPKATGGK